MAGVATHLGIQLDEYDAKIRTFVPWYEDMLDAAADAFRDAVRARAAPRVVDLGIGTGALSARCLAVRPKARVLGIDADAGMLESARARLGRRLTPVHGNFEHTPFPRCDVIVASLSLHHLGTIRHKKNVYQRGFDALTAAGTLVSADCCLASSGDQRRIDHGVWRRHLELSYPPREATALLRAWANEDTYFSLDEEIAMMRAAGFTIDVPWRRHSFAVIVARKKGDA